ncbi:condensation domain-containing protein, partial [Streptomyces sp. NPDC051677]|uniref:condensation domain-containing protein n=1 Tax=Streptomyces sp. NPDC051677 TaxID=3365669 RepID=UPI0037D82696
RRPDGSLKFTGRNDHQVKIRGMRVELGEIEATYADVPGVSQAVVVVREDNPGVRELVAYLVAGERGGHLTHDALEARLKERLPEHMVPRHTVFLPALPLTANLKVDRRALPAPLRSTAVADSSRKSPRNALEAQLVEVFADLLGSGPVGVDADFFALGGDSVLAARAAIRLRPVLGRQIPVRDIFEHRTPEALASALAAVESAPDNVEPDLVPVPRDEPPRLSHMQEPLWFLHQLDRDSPAYNEPVAYTLRGDLDVPALEEALRIVVRRHETLRTAFAPGAADVPVQLIAGDADATLQVEDLRSVPEPQRRAFLDARLAEVSRLPFDLSRPPLWRAWLLRTGDREWVFLLVQHHIITDGRSLMVLLRDLGTAYSALTADRAPELPPVPLQFADYAVWQRARLADGREKAQLAHWRTALAGAPEVIGLRTDRPRSGAPGDHGGRVLFTLDADTGSLLRRRCDEHQVSPYMFLLAVFNLLLHRHCGQDDFVVGSPFEGRQHTALQDLLGFFVNTVPLRSTYRADESFPDYLARVKDGCLSAHAHQDVPFARLVRALGLQGAGYSPLVQVVFAFQNRAGATADFPGLRLEHRPVDAGVARFDLTLFLDQMPEGDFEGSLEYRSDLFDRQTAERLADGFRTLLDRVLADPARRVAAIPIATPQDLQLSADRNDTAVEFPSERCLHELFEEQATRTP